MAFHTIAYAASAQAINAALTALPSITDTMLRVSGNGYIIPLLNRIPLVFAFGPSMTRAQIQTPTLTQLTKQELEPLNNTFPGSTNYPEVIEMLGNPLTVTPFEELDAFITNTAIDGEYLIVWLADGPIVPLAGFEAYGGALPAAPAVTPGGLAQITTGQPFSVRATSATTLAVAGWTTCTLTMDQNIPPGHYQIIGARARSVNSVAFRIVVPGYPWRPGGLAGRGAATAPTSPDYRRQRWGGLGVWAEFDSVQLPSIDVLAQVADTAETFLLDLIRTGPVTSLSGGR